MAQTIRASGGCLCGAVRYEVSGRLRKVVYCHCEQCRRTSGHFVASTACKPEHLLLTNDTGLRWYRSSEEAQRGFCKSCGSSLFWKPEHGKYIALMAGAIDAPTRLTSSAHIYVANASDYLSIEDGLPQHPGDLEDLWVEEDA